MWFYVALALFEWHFRFFRTGIYWCMLVIERMQAPKLTAETVPPPSTTVTTQPAPQPLTPGSAGDGKIQCYEKSTNKPLGVVHANTPEDIKAIVAKARAAQPAWAKTTFKERRRVLLTLLDYVIENHKLICETSAVECGKTLLDGTLGEILTTCEKIQWTILHGEDALADEVRETGLITIYKQPLVRYLPFGVIGAIVSWNYPFHNIVGPMISALFAGNAFVGKVSEFASFFSTTFYEKIVQEALVKCGHSPDLVRFVAGFPDAGAALTDAVDKVTFIGSPQVGKLVQAQAAKTLTPVVLELGGKDPAIVCDDADLDKVLPILMRGTFQNCGQNCVGLERIVAHEVVYDQILFYVHEKVKNLTQGPTPVGAESQKKVFDLGAMTMGVRECERIQKLVEATVARGARLVCGGNWTIERGSFYPPTILADVRPGMPIAEHEVFGPVFVMMKFVTDAGAIEMVNSCNYGLGANVFSKNTARASAIGAQLHTGMLNINDFAINYLCQSLPFGGCKWSGHDRFAGREGLRGCCITRAETRDRFPGVSTEVPPILQYPIQINSFEFGDALIRVLYAPLTSFIGNVLKIIEVAKSNQKKPEEKKQK